MLVTLNTNCFNILCSNQLAYTNQFFFLILQIINSKTFLIYRFVLTSKFLPRETEMLKLPKVDGDPVGETPKDVVEYINAIAPPPPPNEDPHPQFVPTSLVDKLTCRICLDIVQRPVQLIPYSMCPLLLQKYTDHLFFTVPMLLQTCAQQWNYFPTLTSLLNESVVACIRKCGNMVKLQDYSNHLDTRCKSHNVNMNSPSKVTLKDVLCLSTTSPATPVELKHI